jgi:hypothetical protein
MAETQKQSSGDNSVNIQAVQVVVGANYGEIRQIARDVFDANFYRLAQVAKETATQRAEAITES